MATARLERLPAKAERGSQTDVELDARLGELRETVDADDLERAVERACEETAETMTESTRR